MNVSRYIPFDARKAVTSEGIMSFLLFYNSSSKDILSVRAFTIVIIVPATPTVTPISTSVMPIEWSSASCTGNGIFEYCRYRPPPTNERSPVTAYMNGTRMDGDVDYGFIAGTYEWYWSNPEGTSYLDDYEICVSKTINLIVDTDNVVVDSINFPDPVFRQYVLDHFDTNGDAVLSREERDAVTDISGDTESAGIKTMQGVAFFPNLESLSCYGNEITALDPSTTLRPVHIPNSRHATIAPCGRNLPKMTAAMAMKP